jgi:ATP-dependent RNA helicase DOB1
MQEIARRIATVSNECKIPLVPDEYVQSFKMEMMDAVFKWCGGASFSDICKVRPSCLGIERIKSDRCCTVPQMTDIFEGSIIRSFRRLQELLRQMGGAARAIGNEELETKFEDAIKLLERPNTVVFNPSYVTADRFLIWEIPANSFCFLIRLYL